MNQLLVIQLLYLIIQQLLHHQHQHFVLQLHQQIQLITATVTSTGASVLASITKI
jgi:hypothetical protein